MQYFAMLVTFLWIISGQGAELPVLKDGLDAYRMGQFRRAYTIITPWAERGEVQAQFTLALMYSAGQGVEMNEQNAAHWFELAAAQGHRDAQFFLAQVYEQGWGIAPSATHAQEWYQRCAQQGDSRCQARLPQASVTVSAALPESISGFKDETPEQQSLPTPLIYPAPPVEIAATLNKSNDEISPLSNKPNSAISIPEFLGEDWVRTQNPSHYTLQIFTNPAEQDIRMYVKKFNLQGELAILSEIRQGRSWYNLLYGSYPTANAAHKVRSTLPLEIKRDAWVRRFGKIPLTKKNY